MKKISLVLSAFILFLLSFLTNIKNIEAYSSPTPSPKPTTTYELFWPLAAGKTVDAKFFFLKNWKENFKGKLLLGSPAKADYELLLTTKRVIEAEKLLDDKKESFGKKSLELAIQRVEKTSALLTKARQGGENIPSVKDNMLNRIDNLNIFLPRLREKADNDGDKLIDLILARIKDIEKLLQ